MRQVLFILTLFISYKSYSQIGIGTSTPNASAKLDITSSNKGFLPPRISLSATNVATPVASPATGLLVYNTATSGSAPENVVPGYYYWNGVAWVKITANGIASIGSISGSSNVNGATITSGTLNLSPADTTNSGIVTNGSQTFAGNKNFVSNVNVLGTITGNAAISNQVTASFTISSANATTYNGQLIVCNPSAPITITIDNTNPIATGFNIMIVQKSSNSNTITFSAGTNATVFNRSGFTQTAGQYAMANLVHIGNGIFITSGDMQ